MIKPAFYITILFSLLTQFFNAQQNLVFNGDFELYDACPTGPSSFGDYQIEHCIGWNSPTSATPDYINSCNTGIAVGVPYNLGGYQYPHSGNGYTGIIAFNYQEQWYFEYIQGKLLSALEPTTKYHLSLRISCGDANNIAISRIGVSLSQTPLFNANYLPLQATPVVLNSTPITDTSGWMEISGYFFANGGEKFVSIGYIGDTIYSDTIHMQTIPFQDYPLSYYYIDDVLIKVADNQDFINVFTPNGDGINDFIDFSTFVNSKLEVVVLNRWGNVVYSSQSEQKVWDGSNCSEGVYFYRVYSENELKSGFIELMR